MLKDPQNHLTFVLSVVYNIGFEEFAVTWFNVIHTNEYVATSSQLRASSYVRRSFGLCMMSDEAHHIAVC